jgi:hypothetical protein
MARLVDAVDDKKPMTIRVAPVAPQDVSSVIVVGRT